MVSSQPFYPKIALTPAYLTGGTPLQCEGLPALLQIPPVHPLLQRPMDMRMYDAFKNDPRRQHTLTEGVSYLDDSQAGHFILKIILK